jgi:hypothetical protein
MKKLFIIFGITLFTSFFQNPLFAQKELKQQWYLQFSATLKSGLSNAFELQHAEIDPLGNTFISFTSYSTFKFQNKVDTGIKYHLIKIDKQGKVVWNKLFRCGFEVGGGGIGAITSDRNGGVFVQLAIGNYIKFSKDSTFRKTGLSHAIVHYKENGDFDFMTQLPISQVTAPIVYGMNGKLYFPRDRETMYIISSDGKIENSYFPYYFDYSYHYAINKDGQVASIKVLNTNEKFTIGDSTYTQANKGYGYVVVVREKTGAVLWHKFFKNRKFLDIDDNHSVRWDNNNNLYCALNFGSSTPEYASYIQDGIKSIIYKFDQKGNLKGSLFDTAQNTQNNYYTQVWLQNDGSGNVYADLYTSNYSPMNYPNMHISSDNISKYTRLHFDTNFNIQSYNQVRNAPRLDNSLMSHSSIFWKTVKLAQNPLQTYDLPNGESASCTWDNDFFVIFMDTNKQVNSTGIEKFEKKTSASFTLSPNPNSAKNPVTISANIAIDRIIVFDVTGKLVYSKKNRLPNSNTFTIPTVFVPGMYYVRTEFIDGQRQTQKLVVTD